ncbi:hypothetical protein LINGRAHAP2_LOCUS22936 [Linum grandiflorum]
MLKPMLIPKMLKFLRTMTLKILVVGRITGFRKILLVLQVVFDVKKQDTTKLIVHKRTEKEPSMQLGEVTMKAIHQMVMKRCSWQLLT